ncbi:unnamed protein product [Cylicocyclus nassatus]|uniref:Uncharacterized protein n=1 Tax=Cylicocyclus nassatus TaxID=53992 RepID=A0AA36DLM1_CYLNA|nr:unnamed protein product [Cylicocyclus nassatus]
MLRRRKKWGKRSCDTSSTLTVSQFQDTMKIIALHYLLAVILLVFSTIGAEARGWGKGQAGYWPIVNVPVRQRHFRRFGHGK